MGLPAAEASEEATVDRRPDRRVALMMLTFSNARLARLTLLKHTESTAKKAKSGKIDLF